MLNKNIDTIAVRAGVNSDKHCRAVIPAIHLSSTYWLDNLGDKTEFEYSRCSNPTRNLLGDALAKMECGEAGIITNTGTSAIHLICQLLTAKDHVVIPHDLYGGSYRLFKHLSDKGNFKLHIIDQNDLDQVQEALSYRPKMLLIETPSNPLLRLVNISQLSTLFKAVGAIVVVDNTFMTPVLQKPILHGADIVIHSTTKFINGHSDMVGGAVITKDIELGNQLSWWANCIGVTGSAFDSYMALRGLKTLSVRIRQQQNNTREIVKMLKQHNVIQSIHYPGLEEHAGHNLAKQQQSGFGSIVSFEIKGGIETTRAFLSHLKIFTLAQSLGGVESLICHPSSMTHAGMDAAQQHKAGISESLLRLSVGIEFVDDLLSDLKYGLDSILCGLEEPKTNNWQVRYAEHAQT